MQKVRIEDRSYSSGALATALNIITHALAIVVLNNGRAPINAELK